MEYVSIFEDNLWAFRFGGTTEPDEFERLFDQWNDAVFLEDFFTNNITDLQSGFFGQITVQEAILATVEEAKWLSAELRRLSNDGESLDSLFLPLDNRQAREINLSKSKTKTKDRKFKNWLRVYAIRMDDGSYIVTGGAIKLTHYMEEADHTIEELSKLDHCRNFLVDEGICDSEGLIDS